MKRFKLMLVFLMFVILLTGCTNADLESERNALQEEVDDLKEQVDILQKTRDNLIEKDNIVYIIEVEISQSHFTLDLDEHLKDSMNKITIPIQVSEEYYFSIEEGDILSDEFRAGSFLFKGSIGNWKIEVIDKQIVDLTE